MKKKDQHNFYLIVVVIIAIIAIFILISNSNKKITENINSLNDLQIQACNTADEAGTCNSRLPEVGIVLSEECCEALGKCC